MTSTRPAALAAGAAAAVVRATAAALPPAAARIVVDDGLRALQELATAVRRRSAVKVVGITGSAGKTSTKDILAALLRPVARTVATGANLNNEIGVPLTLLEIEPEHRGRRRRDGHARRRADPRAAPGGAPADVGVITNVAPVHLELVGTIDDVAAAKAELIEELTGGTAVVPADEPLLDRHVHRHRGRVVTFGTPDADVHVVDEERRGESTHVLLDAFGHRGAWTSASPAATTCATRWPPSPRSSSSATASTRPDGAAQVAFSDLRGADLDAARRRPAAQRRLQRQPGPP